MGIFGFGFYGTKGSINVSENDAYLLNSKPVFQFRSCRSRQLAESAGQQCRAMFVTSIHVSSNGAMAFRVLDCDEQASYTHDIVNIFVPIFQL
jgi:hypothetical protein